jgi:PAS domain S-box-containing protein
MYIQLVAVFFIFLNTLHANEQSPATSYGQIVIYVILFLVFVATAYYILTTFKKLNERNKVLEKQALDLHYYKQRLDLALKIGNLGTWDTDFLNNKTTINAEWLKVSGFDDNQVRVIEKEDWVSTIHPDDVQRVLKHGSDYKNGLIKEYSIEYRSITKNRKVIWLSSTGAIVQRDENNKVTRMIGVVRDITKEKIYQQQLKLAKTQAEEMAKMKSDFLANMSHEIRTPLNAIIGFIDVLREEETDKVKSEYLDIVNSSSKSLVNIINDILDFSKIESGKLGIEHIDFESHKEFNITKELFKAKADEKHIDLQVIYKDVPQYLKSDILRIKQIVNNLLSNALKFTPDGGTITLSVVYKEQKLLVAVKDSGVGINKDKLATIFEAFSQEDLSTARKYGGTGLGLSISSRLAQLLGGELKVKSELGVGSIFYFEIPVTIGNAVAIEEQNDADLENLEGKKILLVEDAEANQKVMKVLLEKKKMKVYIANDGLEGYKMYTSSKYDCILMDESMPNMSGPEATQEILKYEKENKLLHTPIIALTGNTAEGDRERLLALGMDEYLNKPIDKKKLYQTISSLLS